LLKIREQIKNNPISVKEQSLKFSENSSKCCSISKVHFASRIFKYNC